MKYCPTCSHSYEDETASFCPKDATPLVDKLPSGQSPETMFPGPPRQTRTPTPAPQSFSSPGDSVITPSQVSALGENTMSPSERQNDGSQDQVSAGASDQRSAAGTRMVFNLSELASAAEKSQPESQPKLQPKLQPKPQPKSQAKPQSKSQSVRKRRLLLVLAGIIAIAFVIAVAGIFVWWQHYKTTPAYSLALLVDAVHRNDTATLDRILARDKIADASASQVTQSALGQYTSAAATEPVRKRAESSLIGLLPNIKQMVREEVEKDLRDEASRSAGRSFLLIALAMPYKVGIKQVGDTATVDTRGHPAELTMQRNDGQPWTVIAVKDDTMTSRILSQITKDLPTIGGEKNLATATKKKNPVVTDPQRDSTASAPAKDSTASAPAKNSTASAPAKNSTGNTREKNSTANARTKKKGRRTVRDGIEIELKRIPWPE